MFNHNGQKNDKKKLTSPAQDWHEFDQDLEVYPANESTYEHSASPADGSIPSFGVAKVGSKPGRINPGSTPAQLPDNGQDSKKRPVTESNHKKKSSKPKRVPTKQDNRWRFFFGLGLFVIGLAGSILLVQSNTKGIEVIVATRDITPGQPITSADLATARMSVPPDFAALLVNSGEINSLTETDSTSKSSIKVAARKLRVHQPIMQGDIVSPTTLNKTGVPDGMVAMALPVSASTAVSRITVGDMVNLLYVNSKGSAVDNVGKNETDGTNKGGLGTAVLAEKVVVLDVARSGSSVSLGNSSNSGSGSGDSSVSSSSRAAITNLTLLLTPEQAQKLAVAKETGTVNVVLLPFQVEAEASIPAASASPATTTQATTTTTPNR
ncbi:MAG TPA: RcpC/CpaB family pilus assembly protein [Chloroflexia bacterium]|nr:RcpC/CpaB family pilus assembly protein [Chloroflexia bacterium]